MPDLSCHAWGSADLPQGRKNKITDDEHADADAHDRHDLPGRDAVHMQHDASDSNVDLPQMCFTPLPRLRPPRLRTITNADGLEIKHMQQIRFDQHVTVRRIVPYASVYGYRPSRLVFAGPVGSPRIRFVPHGANPFAGLASGPPTTTTSPDTSRRPNEHTYSTER